MSIPLFMASGLEAYLPLGILVVIAIVFAATNLIASAILGPSHTGQVKEMTYETGMDPLHTARRRFNIRFYVLAMAFLIFDVEIVFLFPWATVFPTLGYDHYLGPQFYFRMLFFVATSIVAYIYAYRKGVFRFD